MRMRKLPGRITKKEARELWGQSKPFVIVPVNISPYNADGSITENSLIVLFDMDTYYRTFDEFCKAYTYYFCNPEVGRYPAFYILSTERNM